MRHERYCKAMAKGKMQKSNPETACKNDTCQCRRLGLKCLPACGKCHGTDCTNGKVDTVVNDEDSDVELED